MRDWSAYVRERLRLPGLAPERESRIVREVAAQLEDFYRDARASGASDTEADRHATRQIADWDRLAADLRRADRPHTRPPLERLADAVEDRSSRNTPTRLTDGRRERAQRREPGERSEPAKRRASETVGESEGRSPSGIRGGQMIADVLRDARYTLRQLTRTPGFAVVTLLR